MQIQKTILQNIYNNLSSQRLFALTLLVDKASFSIAAAILLSRTRKDDGPWQIKFLQLCTKLKLQGQDRLLDTTYPSGETLIDKIKQFSLSTKQQDAYLYTLVFLALYNPPVTLSGNLIKQLMKDKEYFIIPLLTPDQRQKIVNAYLALLSHNKEGSTLAAFKALIAFAPYLNEATAHAVHPQILSQLGNDKASVRRAALKTLTALAPYSNEQAVQASFEAILPLLSDKDYDLRLVVHKKLTVFARHLNETTIQKTLDSILSKLNHPNAPVRKESLQTLNIFIPYANKGIMSTAFTAILSRLNDNDFDVRFAAHEALMTISPCYLNEAIVSEKLNEILSRLKHDNGLIRAAALQVLEAFIPYLHKEAVSEIPTRILPLINDHDSDVNHAALRALAAFAPNLNETTLQTTIEVTLSQCNDTFFAPYDVFFILAPYLNQKILSTVFTALLPEASKDNDEMSDLARERLMKIAFYLNKAAVQAALTATPSQLSNESCSVRCAVLKILADFADYLDETTLQTTLEPIMSQLNNERVSHTALTTLTASTPYLKEATVESMLTEILPQLDSEISIIRNSAFQILEAIAPHLNEVARQKALDAILMQLDKGRSVSNILTTYIPLLNQEQRNLTQLHVTTENLEKTARTQVCLFLHRVIFDNVPNKVSSHSIINSGQNSFFAKPLLDTTNTSAHSEAQNGRVDESAKSSRPGR